MNAQIVFNKHIYQHHLSNFLSTFDTFYMTDTKCRNVWSVNKMFFKRVNSVNEDVHLTLVSRMWVRSFGKTFVERGADKLLHPLQWRRTNAMLSQITINSTVRSTACSGIDQTNYQSSALLAFCEGNPPVTGRFPSQRTSNVENVSMSLYYYVTYMLSVLEAVNHVASTTFNASSDYLKVSVTTFPLQVW